MFKLLDQRSLDKQRKTCRLYLPAPLNPDGVEAWLVSLSGTLRSRFPLIGTPTIALEAHASPMGLTYYLKCPWPYADYVHGQLQEHVPGVRIMDDADYPRKLWKSAVEIGMQDRRRTLFITNPEVTSASLRASMGGLDNGEAIVYQYVISPAHRESKPPMERGHRDELKERREKLEVPNFVCALRIGATANTEKRAKYLIRNVKAAIKSTATAAVTFERRWVTAKALQERIDKASTPLVPPMQLAAPELVAMLAWPLGEGLAPSMPRLMPPDGRMAESGFTLGASNWPGRERPVVLGASEALMHTHALGLTGTGKSVFLGNVARQIMESGYGLMLIETNGNLFQSVLQQVPKERVKDVVLLDLTDTAHPAGFNVLDQGASDTVIDEIIGIFNHKYGHGVWSEEYIFHGLRTLAEQNLSLIDLAPLLTPSTAEEVAWSDEVTRKVKNQELKRWWQRHENRNRADQQKRTDPVLSRIWQFDARPELRHVLGQAKSTINIREVLGQNKILLCNLKTFKDSASLLATFLMNAAWDAIRTIQKDVPTYLMLDEFGDFMDLPVETQSILAQARKHRFGLFLANQFLDQLPREVKDAVVSNARNKVVFQVNRADADVMVREMGDRMETTDYTGLQNYETKTQIMTPYGVSAPMSMVTFPPGKPTGAAAEAVKLSREKYGRPVSEVQAEMERRYSTERPTGKRARISGEGWLN